MSVGPTGSSKYCSRSRPPGLRTLSRKSDASVDAILFVVSAGRRWRGGFQKWAFFPFIHRPHWNRAADLDWCLFRLRLDRNRLQDRFSVVDAARFAGLLISTFSGSRAWLSIVDLLRSLLFRDPLVGVGGVDSRDRFRRVIRIVFRQKGRTLEDYRLHYR